MKDKRPETRKPTFFQKVSNYASEDVKFPLPLAILLETISHFQVMSIVLKAAYPSASNSSTLVSFLKYVILGSGIFSLWDVLPSERIPVILWIGFAAFLVLFILLFLTVVIMAIYHKKNKMVFQILSTAATIHTRILFYPFHYLFLSIINAMFNKDSVEISWLIGSKIIGAITIVLAILNILIGAIKEILFYQINKSKNAYATKNNNFFRLVFLEKAIVPIILIFVGKSDTAVKVIIAVITLLYCCLSFYTLYRKLPFYNVIMLKYSFALVSMTLSISIVGIYTALDKHTKISDTLLIVCVVLIMKISLMKLNELFEKILCGYMPTAELAIHFPILLKRYTAKYTGLILIRDSFPEESLYFYNSFDPNLDEAENFKDPKSRRETTGEFYSKVVDKFLATRINYFKSPVFLLYLARVYIKKLENASKALHLIEKAKSLNGTIPIRNSVHNIQLNLQASFFKGLAYSTEELELANYFIYREDFNSLKENMQEEIKYHLDYWQEISQDHVQVRTVVELSNKIDAIYTKIRSRWRRKSKKFSEVYPSSLLMYGLYIDSIRGLPQESMPIIQRFYNYNKNHGYKNKMGTLNDQTAIILASLEKDKMGTVIDASNTVESLFMIPKDNLVGDKLNALMPAFLSKHHDWFLERYTKGSGEQKLERRIESYGKTSTDFIIELDIDLKLYPYLEKGVNIMAYMKQKSPEEKMFILKPDGTVAGGSVKMQEIGAPYKLNFKMGNTLQSFDELDKVNHAFNLIYGIAETKTQAPLDSDMGFIKEKTHTDEFNFPTRENHPTQNFTNLETNTDMLIKNLKTKVDDMSPIGFEDIGKVESMKFQSSIQAWNKNKYFTTESKFSSTPLPKSKVQLTEEEAREICNLYENGNSMKHINFGITLEGKKTNLVMDLIIKPYILGGEVYKVCRVFDLQVQEHKHKKETHSSHVQSPTLHQTVTHEFKANPLVTLKTGVFKTMNSSFASRGSEFSDEEIPEERSEIYPEMKERDTADIDHRLLYTKTVCGENNSDPSKSLQKKIDSLILETNKEEQLNIDVDVVRSITKGASSTKSHSRMDLKLIKTLNDFFGEQKIRLTTRISVYGVYLIMLGVLVLAFVNYFFTNQALGEISNGVTIVGTASQRLTSVLRAWQWILLIYSRLVGLRSKSTIASLLQQNCLTETQNMQRLNGLLKSNINEFGSKEIVDIIFSTKIRFFDPVTNELITNGTLDSFTANNLLGLKNLLVGTWTGDDDSLLKRSEPLTAINNTANDFLMSSEIQISEILGGLENIILKNEDSLLIILIAENLALLVLCGSLLIVARVVLRTYSRTFQALVRLTPNSVEDRVYRIKKFQASLNDNIEAKSFVKNLNLYFSFFEENAERKLYKSKTKDKKTRLFARAYSNRGLVLYIAKYLGVSFIFIMIISGLFEVLYIESIDSFNKLDGISTQLSISNKLSYQSSLVLSSFYFNAIFSSNVKMLIRDEAPSIQVTKNLDAFGGVNQELLNTLFTSKNGYDPTLQNFLQKDVCTYIADKNKTTCLQSTQNGALGLLGLNQKYYTTSNNYWNMYQGSNTLDSVKVLVEGYFNDVTLDITVLDQAYSFLTSYITDNFTVEVDNLEDVNLLLSLGAMFFIVIATIMIQRITIKTLITLDNSQKKLFRVLTYNVFSQNKSVAFILKKEFGNEVEGLNRLLNA